jgi:hypothetical protein
MVIGTEAVQSDTERFIVVSTSRFKNGLKTDADIDLVGTSKLLFSSNNYFQNDSGHNLNLFLNNSKNFIANTGNDQSSFEFKIDGNPVMKMTRDLTSNPALPNNTFQVSSEKLTVKDDAVAGGYMEIERTGASGVLAGYINYYTNVGRLMYTGFNDGAISGNPLHYFENICKSYTFKNSLGPIMKIVSHTGTLSAVSNYVEINRRLECPTLQLYAAHADGTVPSDSVTSIAGEINSKTIEESNIGRLTLSAGGGTDATAKSRIDIYGSDVEANRKINFRVGDQLNMTIKSSEVEVAKNIVPSGSINIGTSGNPWNNVYANTVTTPTVAVSSSLITSDTSTITFNNNITTTRSIMPQNTVTYDIGSFSKLFNNIHCGSLFCVDGQVGNNSITSDRRFKTNIIDLDPNFGLNFVDRMRPVSYTYKGRTRTHFGVIADEIYDLLQTDKYSIWSKLKDEQQTQTVQTAEFIGVFIKSIQELHGTVKQQASKIDELERQQVDLMRSNNELERTQMKTIKRILKLEAKLNF